MIVATAGHVDHGKSTIVRRLTGTDPDRWAEERERGLTLDLGFAWTLLPSGRTVAFVDVPGHRRYVANALAGTAAVDGVLLAVSAREGWRAQTEEHVAMLELGGAPTGVVALTFADAVDGPALRNARAAVAARLEGTFLEGAEIVPTRADGRRDGALRRALDDAVAACPTALDTGRPRLWIDRSFLLDGVGRVVTGTLTGGSVAVGDHVDAVEGAGATPLRIRSARRNGRPVERATPGGRVALAVRAGGPAPRRGAAVVRRAQWSSGRVLHVVLVPARDRDRPRSRGSYLLHVGTWSAPVRLAHPAGAEGDERRFARLLLDAPAGPLSPGDRFVLRDAGRAATVAGGTILAIDAETIRRSPASLACREAAVRGTHPERVRRLAAALLDEGDGTAPAAAVLAATGASRPPGTRATGATLVSVRALRRARRALSTRLEQDEAVEPTGPVEALAARQLVQRALADERDGALHRPGTDPRRRWLAVAERLDGAVRAGALGPLWTREEAAAAGAGPGEVRRLVEEGLVVPVPPFLATRSTYAHLATSVAARVAEGPATTASLKSLLGLTRRTAIPLLEALDRDGVTRREGDARVPGGHPAGGR